jgi:hypothetical protein
VYQLQVGRPRYVDALNASLLRFPDDVLFSDDHEVRLVRDQRKHDQVGVRSVEAVSRVGIVAWLLLLVSNEVHHFVLAFAGHTCVGNEHSLALLVDWIGVDLELDEPFELPSEFVHEWRARRYLVAIEQVRHLLSLIDQFLPQIF